MEDSFAKAVRRLGHKCVLSEKWSRLDRIGVDAIIDDHIRVQVKASPWHLVDNQGSFLNYIHNCDYTVVDVVEDNLAPIREELIGMFPKHAEKISNFLMTAGDFLRLLKLGVIK